MTDEVLRTVLLTERLRDPRSACAVRTVSSLRPCDCPSGLVGQVHLAWEAFQHGRGVQFVSCERWTVDRCGEAASDYTVHYLQRDDVFWTKCRATSVTERVSDYINKKRLRWM